MENVRRGARHIICNLAEKIHINDSALVAFNKHLHRYITFLYFIKSSLYLSFKIEAFQLKIIMLPAPIFAKAKLSLRRRETMHLSI